MSLASKSASIFSRDVVFTIIRIGTGIVVARKLGPVGVGVWAVLDLLINYARVFGAPRFEISCVHFLGKKEYDRGEIIYVTNVIALVTSLLILALFFPYIEAVKGRFFKDIPVASSLIAATACYLPILFLSRNYQYFLLSRERIGSYNIMLIIQDGVKAILTIALLLIFDLGLWALTIGILISGVLSLVYGAAKVHATDKIRPVFNFRLFRDMFRFSYTVYFSEATGFLNMYLSNLITAILLMPSALAFFSMGKGKAEWLNRITNAMSTVLYPRISNQAGNLINSTEITTRAFRLSIILLTVLGSIGCAFIYPAAIIMYGKQFAPLALSFWIIIPGLVVYSSSNIQRQYFLGIGRPDIPLKISFLPLILQGVLCYLFIPRMGFTGAALAVSVTFFVTGLITVVVYKRLSSNSYRDIVIPKKSDFDFLLSLTKEYSRKAGKGIISFAGTMKRKVNFG